MIQESKKLLENAARAVRSFGAEPVLVYLHREPACDLTPAQAAAALQSLAALANAEEPLVGWWQEADCVAHTAQREPSPLPNAAVMEVLLEGEWTCGKTTLQLRRHGHLLRQSRLVELPFDAQAPAQADANSDVHAALAQKHALLGRTDLAVGSITVVVYSIWDAQRHQVVPVAQRLLFMGMD